MRYIIRKIKVDTYVLQNEIALEQVLNTYIFILKLFCIKV